MTSTSEVDGVSRQSFSLEVNAKDYGFEPTDTPRTDRSFVSMLETDACSKLLLLVVLLWTQLLLVLKGLLDGFTKSARKIISNNMPYNEQIRIRLAILLVFATLPCLPFKICMSKYKF